LNESKSTLTRTLQPYLQQSCEAFSKSGIMPFPKKGNFLMTTNYQYISLTPIAA